MANITVNNHGPYVIRGEIELVDASGNTFTKNETFALCRCGHAANKPFCYGGHSREGLDSEVEGK